MGYTLGSYRGLMVILGGLCLGFLLCLVFRVQGFGFKVLRGLGV